MTRLSFWTYIWIDLNEQIQNNLLSLKPPQVCATRCNYDAIRCDYDATKCDYDVTRCDIIILGIF